MKVMQLSTRDSRADIATGLFGVPSMKTLKNTPKRWTIAQRMQFTLADGSRSAVCLPGDLRVKSLEFL